MFNFSSNMIFLPYRQCMPPRSALSNVRAPRHQVWSPISCDSTHCPLSESPITFVGQIDLKQRDSAGQYMDFLRTALSLEHENKFWEAFSGVCGAVLVGLFEYVKGLTNMILFWSGDSAGQVLASQGCTVCILNTLCKLILIWTFQFQLLSCFD